MTGNGKSKAERPVVKRDRQGLPGQGRYADKPLEELIDMLEELVLELKSRKEEATEVIGKIPKPEFPNQELATESPHFVKLPRSTSNRLPEVAALNWHIVLTSSDYHHKPLYLEIYNDIIVGRTQEYIIPDLDLTEYDALTLGVSRQHALLHPTADGLEIVDLLSANGTLVNEVKLKKGEYRSLKNDDVLSFGLLHFKLQIVRRPDSSQAGKKAKP